MSIRKRPDSGLWWVDVTSPSGKRVRCSTGTSNRKEAQEFHDKLKAQLWREDALGELPEHTLDDAALQMLKLSDGQRDYAAKVRHVKYWRSALGGDTLLSSLTAGRIMQALPTHTTHKDRPATPLSAASKNRYLATIRRMLNLAVQAGWLVSAPKLGRFREPKQRVRWEPRPIIAALIDNLRLPWMQDVVRVAVATGMREDEILSLMPADVDLERSTAWVRAENAKSGRARAVPLNEDALAVLERRMKTCITYVFERPPSKGLTPRKISQIDDRDLKRACEAVGIKDFRFHDFRHTWASWHVQAGTPLMVLKELGGWETVEMVQKYAHLAKSHLASYAANVTFTARSAQMQKTAPARERLIA